MKIQTIYRTNLLVYSVSNPSIELRRCATALVERPKVKGGVWKFLLTDEIARTFLVG